MSHGEWIQFGEVFAALAGLLGMIGIVWFVLEVGLISSASDERDDYIFDDTEPFPHWDVSDSEMSKTDPHIQLLTTGSTDASSLSAT